MKTKAGEWKGGQWYPNKDTELQVNNPKGFNRHKKNPNPKPKELNQLETFTKLPLTKQKTKISELGNEIYMLQKELRPKLLQFNKFKDYYEKKHFGWDWEKD